MKTYDAIVIGSGVSGLSAAYGLKEAGKTVLVVEEDLWGGTCPNRGCDPKKVLLSAVEARNRVKQLSGKGFNEIPTANWEELQKFKRTFTDPVPESRKKQLAEAEIDHLSGTARFLDDSSIEVNEEVFHADYFVLATGQRPTILPVEGKEYLKTSADFLSLPVLPKEIIFIGGGYIAFELATIANAAGSKVTIVHHNQRPLKEFEASLVEEAVHQMEASGIQFAFGVETQKIISEGTRYRLVGKETELVADMIFCATGRQPNTESLALEQANVVFDKHGIAVNDYLQTSNPKIFACGDIVSRKTPKLTPVATFEGNYVAKRITDATSAPIKYPIIPTIVYASPKLAEVGVTKSHASSSDQVVEMDLTSWFTYHRVNEPVAKAELTFDQQNYLIGAAVISEQADELIDDLTLVINQKLTKKELDSYIMGYPTLASDLSYLLK